MVQIDNDVFFIAETQAVGKQVWKIQHGVVNIPPIQTNSFNLTVFPNPCATHLNIVLPSDNSTRFEGQIYDIQGRTVRKFTPTMPQTKILLEDLLPGFYFVELKNEQDRIVEKFVKK